MLIANVNKTKNEKNMIAVLDDPKAKRSFVYLDRSLGQLTRMVVLNLLYHFLLVLVFSGCVPDFLKFGFERLVSTNTGNLMRCRPKNCENSNQHRS